jgi:hypothetical protein
MIRWFVLPGAEMTETGKKKAKVETLARFNPYPMKTS